MNTVGRNRGENMEGRGAHGLGHDAQAQIGSIRVRKPDQNAGLNQA